MTYICKKKLLHPLVFYRAARQAFATSWPFDMMLSTFLETVSMGTASPEHAESKGMAPPIEFQQSDCRSDCSTCRTKISIRPTPANIPLPDRIAVFTPIT